MDWHRERQDWHCYCEKKPHHCHLRYFSFAVPLFDRRGTTFQLVGWSAVLAVAVTCSGVREAGNGSAYALRFTSRTRSCSTHIICVRTVQSPTVACWRYRSCEVTLTTLFYDMPLAKYCSFLAQWQQSVPPASRGAVDIRCTTRAETELTGLYIRGWTSDDGASRRSYAEGKERLALPAMLSGKGPSRSAADSALTVIDQGPTTQWQQPT